MQPAPMNARQAMSSLQARLTPMTGRNPNEAHRAATPLELLFDLVFVIAFAQASSQFAHYLAEGEWGTAIGGFAFTMFAVIWAWMNFSWFASAFDTDDWAYRLLTMVQMFGVMIVALGIDDVFTTFHEGGSFQNHEVIFGYVVMRLALVAQWYRASRQDPAHREAALTYITATIVAQIGWVALMLASPPINVWIVAWLIGIGIEVSGPYLAERKCPTPWHAHHIAERYTLLTIISFGECITGTFMAVKAALELEGWTWQVGLLGFASIALTFGLWWMYFMLPSGAVLHHRRQKGFPWAFGHMPVFAAITAVGAGLHVAAYYISHHAHVGILATVLTVVIPVSIFIGLIFVIYSFLVEAIDRFHYLQLAGVAIVQVVVVLMAVAHVPVAICLMVEMLAPAIVVLGYELVAHEHHAAVMRKFSASH